MSGRSISKARLGNVWYRLVEKSGFSQIFIPRVRLANQYLRGKGLEIGALSAPLKVPNGVSVEYVDIATKEDSIRKFPEINRDRIVEVTHIMDGFMLEKLPSNSVDFVIANHVLEHTPNPIGAIEQWHRVIKPSGILFCAVPVVDKCFDKGREITSVTHMSKDYSAYQQQNTEEIRKRNRNHYLEWITVSAPVIVRDLFHSLPRAEFEKRVGNQARLLLPSIPQEEIIQMAEELLDRTAEIHFHTFTPSSFKELFRHLSESLLPGLILREVVPFRNEVIAIVQKGPAAHSH